MFSGFAALDAHCVWWCVCTQGIGVQSSLPPLPTQQALTQPLPVLQPQPSPQFHHQGASSGAVPATGSAGGAGGASRAFGSKEMSELSSFFYTTVMESQRKLDKEGQDVVATLLKVGLVRWRGCDGGGRACIMEGAGFAIKFVHCPDTLTGVKGVGVPQTQTLAASNPPVVKDIHMPTVP